MPEGHTIHRIAKDHSPLLVGRPVAVSSPQGRFAADAALVNGVVLDRIEPYGKHLFYWWANGLVGHVHLGLFGKFRVAAGPQVPAVQGMVRMRMSSDGGTVDLAGPTDCSIGSADDRDAIIGRLGPDPLRRDAKPADALARLRKSAQPIGALLLDQELSAVWDTVFTMLRKGVKDNRIITIDRKRFPVPKGQARRGDTTYVYHRDVCLLCDTPVRTVELGGRACYYCPTCQPR